MNRNSLRLAPCPEIVSLLKVSGFVEVIEYSPKLSLHPSSQPSFLSDPGELPPTESEAAAFSWRSLPSCPLFPALGFASLLSPSFRAQSLTHPGLLTSFTEPLALAPPLPPTPPRELPLHSDAHSQITATTSSLDGLTVVLPPGPPMHTPHWVPLHRSGFKPSTPSCFLLHPTPTLLPGFQPFRHCAPHVF